MEFEALLLENEPVSRALTNRVLQSRVFDRQIIAVKVSLLSIKTVAKMPKVLEYWPCGKTRLEACHFPISYSLPSSVWYSMRDSV